MLDIPLTALVFAALYFLEKSKAFSKLKYTIAFFIASALMFLTKWYGFVFILVPLVFTIVDMIKKGEGRRLSWKGLVWGMSLFSLIVFPWYSANLQALTSTASYTSQGELADPQSLLSFDNFFFYPRLIMLFQLTFAGTLFLASSLILLIKSLKSNKQLKLILLSLVASILFFTFVPNKNIRILMPAMPFLAVFMALGMDKGLKKLNPVYNFLTSIVVSYLVISYLILSFGLIVYPQYKYAVNAPLLGWMDLYYLDSHPVKVIFDEPALLYEAILKDVSNLEQ